MISEKPILIANEEEISLTNGYLVAKSLNLVNLHPWHFLSDLEFDGLSSGLNNRYSIRRVIPFARRTDNDDVACIVVMDHEQPSGQIIIIHNYASPGYEVVVRQQTFWDWFKFAVDDMIEWHQHE